MGGSEHDRRQFIALGAKSALALGVASALPGSLVRSLVAAADPAAAGLSDPSTQPLFDTLVPNALDPGFKYSPTRGGRFYQVGVSSVPDHRTGLLQDGSPVDTQVFAYGPPGGDATWPGMTFEIPANTNVNIEWQNNLPAGGEDARPPIWTNAEDGFVRNAVDTSLHWCYSLHGYEGYTIDQNGVPIVVHVHGGHNRPLRDGNPEYFFSPGYGVTGPRWSGPVFQYPNDQPAGNLWYHDHALGITRLNVYAGMAGFYFLRDDYDTGLAGNPAGLPAGDYELAYAIQDRMFVNDGRLFYPSYPDDPFYNDFITGEGAVLPQDLFPGGGPTALAEFFGDHMVVNGKIWPKADVEPTKYRIHLLNGCDSRFLAVQLFEVEGGDTDFTNAGGPLPFDVIGSDQGLATSTTTGVETLLMETGSRYDLIVDFANVTPGNRVIMKNIGGDDPFGGDIPGPIGFGETDRIMAFDVAGAPSTTPAVNVNVPSRIGTPTRTRKVALFEGKDNFGRLQPLLGTAEPATDAQGKPINWPDTEPYVTEGLIGQMEGSIAWHSPTTENPAMNSTEEWEIWNVTGDAHPVHLHLVHYEILGRQQIDFDTNIDDDGFIPDGTEPAGDGIYVVPQPVIQHDGEVGQGFRIVQPPDPADAYGNPVDLGAADGYVENAPKDMVTALPGQITKIKATFDKSGRYVWHCHILSHEDHEMMRVLEVGGISGRPGGRP